MKTNGRRYGKIQWGGLICVLVLLVLTLVPGTRASAGSLDAEARGMLSLINDFRKGSDAWYWNEDNSARVVVSGLKGLQYDYALEEVARVRAQEISVKFSHERPDGSKWSTAFPEGNYYKGENIACGYPTAAEAFRAFQEEDLGYAGQGHRRNMLRSEYTRIGLSAVEVNGMIYWVQEFASGSVSSSGGNGSGASDASSADPTRGEWVKKKGNYYYKYADGSLAKGWLKADGKWYYLNKKGVMQTGWVKDSGKKYFMDDSGAMTTGWLKHKNKWYYFAGDGAMQKGWLEIDGQWYYFQSSGEMATGTVNIDGQQEVFSKKGIWKHSIIEDYDTPLGTSPVIHQIRLVIQFFREILEALRLV